MRSAIIILLVLSIIIGLACCGPEDDSPFNGNDQAKHANGNEEQIIVLKEEKVKEADVECEFGLGDENAFEALFRVFSDEVKFDDERELIRFRRKADKHDGEATFEFIDENHFIDANTFIRNNAVNDN